MKKLLLSALICSNAYLMCSDPNPHKQPVQKEIQTKEDSESLFSLLQDPLKRSGTSTSPFETIKATCKHHHLLVRSALDPATGDSALHVLFNGALSRAEESPINSSVDWHFSFATLHELLLCGLDPEEPYTWHNPTTQQTEIKPSYFALLEEHRDKPGVLFITEKTKVFVKAIAEDKKKADAAAASNRLWVDILAMALDQ